MKKAVIYARVSSKDQEREGYSLYPAYTKPFDLIFERAKTEEWCARRDSNSRPIAPEAIQAPWAYQESSVCSRFRALL